MTRDRGGFADRGVHTQRGNVVTIIPTPCLALMRCHACRAIGVVITALTADQPDGEPGELLGWCTFAHARAEGLWNVPPKPPLPSPARKKRHAH